MFKLYPRGLSVLNVAIAIRFISFSLRSFLTAMKSDLLCSTQNVMDDRGNICCEPSTVDKFAKVGSYTGAKKKTDKVKTLSLSSSQRR